MCRQQVKIAIHDPKEKRAERDGRVRRRNQPSIVSGATREANSSPHGTAQHAPEDCCDEPVPFDTAQEGQHQPQVLPHQPKDVSPRSAWRAPRHRIPPPGPPTFALILAHPPRPLPLGFDHLSRAPKRSLLPPASTIGRLRCCVRREVRATIVWLPLGHQRMAAIGASTHGCHWGISGNAPSHDTQDSRERRWSSANPAPSSPSSSAANPT